MVFENQICDRCHRPTVTRIMSMFNLDMICPACKEDERKHPLYELACQKEREALQRGVRNFPGIGWPAGDHSDRFITQQPHSDRLRRSQLQIFFTGGFYALQEGY